MKKLFGVGFMGSATVAKRLLNKLKGIVGPKIFRSGGLLGYDLGDVSSDGIEDFK